MTERRHEGPNHQGPARTSPYPLARGAQAIGLPALAEEIERAEELLTTAAQARLEVIVDQIRHLQDQAREVLERTSRDQDLHRAACAFRKVPGHVYHLYREPSGATRFSMLSPDDWRGKPPFDYVGAYRLERDMTWTSAADAEAGESESKTIAQRLLSGG